jgi:threonine dehydratase
MTRPHEASAASLDGLLREILTARVYDVARETPLDPAPRLSARLGCEVLLKREDLQPTFSFKVRGAYNCISQLGAAERRRGVIAASAGNHAQGVALAAGRLGIRALIVMPRTTPEIKVEAVRALGAEVELAGDHYAEAQQQCERRAAEEGLVPIHPFDDPRVIAGQGTVGDEIVRQRPGELDAVFVPVGGGGLIAGIGAYLKAVVPAVKVIGVEPVDADAMARSLEAGRRVRLEQVGIFADAVAVSEVGAHTFAIAQRVVDGVLRVGNDEICAAIKDVFEDTRVVVEPAGALAVAGAKAFAAGRAGAGGRIVAVLSGANVNFGRLGFVTERAELGEAREALFAVTIPERPGAFRAFCAALGPRVITEFNYRLHGREEAHIFVGVAVDSRRDAEALADELRARGHPTEDLSDDELAKLHIRHMVGGRAPEVRGERVVRFKFPERPGALLQFLDTLGGRWNISLFHYRNHGSDFGRVLAGFEVPEADRDAFASFLEALRYEFEPEQGSAAYRLFLA